MDEEEKRLKKERARKGKAVVSRSTRSRTAPSVEEEEETISPVKEVHSTEECEEPTPGSDDGPRDSEEDFVPGRPEVWLTRELLESMRKFEDQKRATTYKERCSAGKMAKSGKQYSSKELRMISCDEDFRSRIHAIGFDWLLKHSHERVPVDLAREFFSTFRLKNTTDLDADAITFRLFNEEYEMSIREWSLRMGLFTQLEDTKGAWYDRMVGLPKNTPGFKVQTAWEEVTHPESGKFKSSYSKASHIEDRILRFAQTFISYNLMGTANSSLTTVDLYFTWCMARGIKVHLGYWMAQACHQMTSNPTRHMYTCHILGAYLQRNIEVKIAKTAPLVVMCEEPETFSVEYFFNKGLLTKEGKQTYFYETGDKAKAESGEATETIPSEEIEELCKEVEELRKEVQGMKKEVTSLKKGVMTELGGVSRELKESREEVQTLRGNIADLAVKSAKQNDRMTEAVDLVMKMLKWLERTLPLTKAKTTPGSSSEVRQYGQGTSVQKSPHSPKPVVDPSLPKPASVPVKTKTVMKRTGSEKREEEPELPAQKKAKTTRPGIPSMTGSRGSQPRQ